MHQEGADIESFLQERIDFDFVSPSLSRMGLKREQLMQESVSASIPADEPVTQEVIVDIENFRSKEHLPEKFTIEWIRKLTQWSESDQMVKKSLKQMITS